MRRVVLVGCGRQAQRAHLPVLARLRERVALVAVVDLADQERAVRQRLAAAGLDGGGTGFVGVGAARHFALPGCDGVIVSSPPLTHRTYIDAALAAGGVGLLVDKPLTVRRNARRSAAEARAIVEDFRDIRERSGGRLAMVAAQRRYHPFYRRIGQHLHAVHAKTGHGVTFVQSLTNDGLWNESGAYFEGGLYDPATTGGGKLINTGYHLLDTIPWLLRHCQGEGVSDIGRIRGAEVYAQFFGPEDAVALAPNGGLWAQRTGNEINACLQMAFLDEEERTVCLWQLGALHEGISVRRTPKTRLDEEDPAGAGRTKQDVLTMYQGPVSAVWMRRIAKLLPSDGAQVGESGHAELLCAQNVYITGGERPLEQLVGPYVDSDDAPTEEFLAALCGEASPDDVASPTADQAIAVGILAAAYESAATQRSVRVPFDGAEWTLPPAALSYLSAPVGVE